MVIAEPFRLHEVCEIRDKAKAGKQVSPQTVERLCETVFLYATEQDAIGEIHQMLVEALRRTEPAVVPTSNEELAS